MGLVLGRADLDGLKEEACVHGSGGEWETWESSVWRATGGSTQGEPGEGLVHLCD